MWNLLGIVSALLLLKYWSTRNAVWGGFTGGVMVGVIIAILTMIRGGELNWFIIGKGAIVGTLLGLVAELLGKLSDKMRS